MLSSLCWCPMEGMCYSVWRGDAIVVIVCGAGKGTQGFENTGQVLYHPAKPRPVTLSLRTLGPVLQSATQCWAVSRHLGVESQLCL